MSEQTLTQSQPPATRRERGLGYAVAGGLGITLLAVTIGGILIVWFYAAQSRIAPPEILPADTQLYATIAPTLGDLPEAQRVAGALRENFAIQDIDAIENGVEGLLGVQIEQDVITWLGSGIAVSVNNFNPPQSVDPAEALLRDGDLLIFLTSRNDPQAEAFLEKHRAARESRGERIAAISAGETTVYVQEGGEPSPITAFALIDHHIIFANRAELLVNLAISPIEHADSLAAVPSFATFSENLSPSVSGGLYTDGAAEAEAARSALRTILADLGT
ncbi:MAG: DUF3352 domain-containing protein [Oscillochloris sp.]|nr:DUF3352 domain-containing protein [Oscillochloris sp.]